MVRLFTTAVLLLISCVVVMAENTDEVYAKESLLDVAPEFPDGDKGLMKYVYKNINWTDTATKGRMVVDFVIGSDGKVGTIEISNSLDPALAAEVERVIGSLPPFTPGRVGDKTVGVWKRIWIKFPIVTKRRRPDTSPEFVGGRKAMWAFIHENMNYPDECAQKGIEGEVGVRFKVLADGSIGDIKVTQPVDSLLDAEAVRLVSMLPKFTPGTAAGRPVNVWKGLKIRIPYYRQKSDEDAKADEYMRTLAEMSRQQHLDEPPVFRGGNKDLVRYINRALRYPSDCALSLVEGDVTVRYTVHKDGSVGDVKVIKSAHQSLDREAVRVVSSLPKFKPGISGGEPVNVTMMFTVHFELDSYGYGEDIDWIY